MEAMKRTDIFIISSKKKSKKTRDKKMLYFQRFKYKVSRFLDPYQNYRLYGDMIFSNKLWNISDKEPIYSFELYKNYKAFRQIHIREHGVILELEDFDENETACTSFVKSRLKSLGDQKTSNFADFLDNYDDYFMEDQDLRHQNDNFNQGQAKIFNWIDDIFEKHQEDVVFIRGNKMLTNKDFRTRYLCYNFLMLEWITNDSNPFSDEFITNCFQVFFFKDLDEFINILKSIIVRKMQKTGGSKILPKYINTLAGKIKIMVEVDTHIMQKEGMFFHYIIHSKKNQDPSFLQKIQKYKKNFEERKKKITELEREKSICYSELIMLYYLNKKL